MKRLITYSVLLLTLLILAVGQTQAQSGAVWNAEFFNNSFFSGVGVLQRQDNMIAFNWGLGSPSAGVNSDNFTARWGTDVFLEAGTYRFWALADEDVKIIIDFNHQPLIDSFFGTGSAGETLSADVTLGAGVHHIQVDYREFEGPAYIFVTWANLATNPSGPNFPVPQPPTTGGTWTAQYFANASLIGVPTLTRTEVNPTGNWGSGSPDPSIPADNFSARWTTTQILANGVYRVNVQADDGVRVFVDGVLVINEWHLATGARYSVDVNLLAGTHTITVEYFESSGGAFLDFNFAPTTLPAVTPTPPAGIWTATYFDNINLTGFPVATLSEISPAHNWGVGAPAPNIPADNFSARWTTTQALAAGRYRIDVQADDGVRVFVDGSLVIDEWHTARAQAYATEVNLTAGLHTITIEFFEANGVAFLNYTLTLVDTAAAPTGAIASVTAATLNVREAPSTRSDVMTRIRRGETYAIVGRNADSSWWQVNVNGTIGWVFGRFVNTANTASVPITDASFVAAPPSTGIIGTVNTTAIVRGQPGNRFAFLALLRNGDTVEIVGRNANGTWLQVKFDGVVGWISANLVNMDSFVSVNQLPVNS
jgi:uncharacterized protein YraI